MSVSPAGSGLQRLSIDGKPFLPFWIKVNPEDPLEGGGPDRWEKVQYTLQQAAKAGALPIVAFVTDRLNRNSSAVEGGTDWQFSQATPFDNRTEDLFAKIASYAPDALLYPTVWPWFDRHDNGACEIPGGHCEPTLLQDSRNASNTRPGFANSPSADWATQAAAKVQALMCYLDRRFPGKIFGLQLNGMETGGA